MLDPLFFVNNLSTIQEIYSDLHTSALESIARRMSDTIRNVGEPGVISATRYQIEAVLATGLLQEDIERHIARALRLSNAEVRALFEDASIKSVAFDNKVYEQAGLEPVDIRMNERMLRTLEAGINKQHGTLRRLTGTFAVNAEDRFHNILNVAYNETIHGIKGYQQAINDACDELIREGIGHFYYSSGRQMSIEAAVLMNVRTGIAQTAGTITQTAIEELGATHVQTSAHANARNVEVIGKPFAKHTRWQGRVFQLDGSSAEYENFHEAVGWGDVQGLYGINCRHSHAPFFVGITPINYTPDELRKLEAKTYTYKNWKTGEETTVDAYKASQILRYLERQVRQWKRAEAVMKAAGIPHENETYRKELWQQRIRDFTEQSGIRRQISRERIAQP